MLDRKTMNLNKQLVIPRAQDIQAEASKALGSKGSKKKEDPEPKKGMDLDMMSVIDDDKVSSIKAKIFAMKKACAKTKDSLVKITDSADGKMKQVLVTKIKDLKGIFSSLDDLYEQEKFKKASVAKQLATAAKAIKDSMKAHSEVSDKAKAK